MQTKYPVIKSPLGTRPARAYHPMYIQCEVNPSRLPVASPIIFCQGGQICRTFDCYWCVNGVDIWWTLHNLGGYSKITLIFYISRSSTAAKNGIRAELRYVEATRNIYGWANSVMTFVSGLSRFRAEIFWSGYLYGPPVFLREAVTPFRHIIRMF